VRLQKQLRETSIRFIGSLFLSVCMHGTTRLPMQALGKIAQCGLSVKQTEVG